MGKKRTTREMVESWLGILFGALLLSPLVIILAGVLFFGRNQY